MRKKIILCIPAMLALIIIVFLLFKYINNSNNSNYHQKYLELTEERIKELITKSDTYYLLNEGNINISTDDKIIVDGIEYFPVLLDDINSIEDIRALVNDIIIYTFVDVRLGKILNSDRKYMDYNDKLYVSLNNSTCDINYNLADKPYEITKVDDTRVDLKFTIDNTHNYIFPLYNYDGSYKMIDTFYGCYMNIKENTNDNKEMQNID